MNRLLCTAVFYQTCDQVPRRNLLSCTKSRLQTTPNRKLLWTSLDTQLRVTFFVLWMSANEALSERFRGFRTVCTAVCTAETPPPQKQHAVLMALWAPGSSKGFKVVSDVGHSNPSQAFSHETGISVNSCHLRSVADSVSTICMHTAYCKLDFQGTIGFGLAVGSTSLFKIRTVKTSFTAGSKCLNVHTT